jgi:serine/threonine-protein kinase
MDTQQRLLAGRYELTALVAGGGMGRVWRGRDTLLDRPVAVKVLRDDVAADATFLARFRAEAQHAALLTHPHIAAVFDYGEVRTGSPGVPLAYLVLELVDGESLAGVLTRTPVLGVERTLDVVRQTADGLAAAHAAGVVHRDVKPANLLVRRDGLVKITDFGIARSTSSASVTATGQVLGTAHYLSPEQAMGQPSTPASDVYALGVVAYECLTGRRAFDGENPVQIAVKHTREEPAPLPAHIPAAVRALVERAMAKDPAARFPDGAALRDAVDRVVSGAPTAPVARPTRTAVLPAVPAATALGARPGRAAPRRRWLLPALAALAVVVVGVAVLVAALAGGSTPPAGGDPARPTSTSPTGIEVAADEYVGRPVADVQAALIGTGLQVRLVPVQSADVPAGQVTAVAPVGDIDPGATVQVSYAVPPVVVPTPAPTGNGNGNGNANGNGKGKGHGHHGGEGNGD